MTAHPLNDFSKLCVHTITTRPWPIEEAIDHYAASGVRGVSVWRQWLEGRDIAATGRRIRDAGLEAVSLCRGGFFPSVEAAQRQAAIEDNLRAIDEAEALGAPLIVLVCGADPNQPLSESRKQIQDGIVAVLDHAIQADVKLAIEPIHPMYAAKRSAINDLMTANDMCDAIGSPQVGVAIDVYHIWWEPRLQQEIARAGKADRLFAFHVCDWRFPLEDMLNDRGLMGDGCIDIRQIRGWMEASGFHGFNEVEVFSNRYWATDQNDFLEKIKAAYLERV